MDPIGGTNPKSQKVDDVEARAFRKDFDFDLIIIGSGPAGQKAAIAAAKSKARVALVERDPLAGGVCLNTGTIPSKSLREAILYLSGYRQRGYYGKNYRLKDQVTTGDLLERTNYVIALERENVNEEVLRNGAVRLVGTGRVTGPNEVSVELNGNETRFSAWRILIGVGTHPRRPDDVPFDDVNIFDSDAVFGSANELRPLPDSIIVMGAGVVGIEYASMFGALDIPTILVDPRENPLGFVDREISEVLYRHLENNGVTLKFGTSYKSIGLCGEGRVAKSRVDVVLGNGEEIEADALLFSLGRLPSTQSIGLKDIGVELDRRGYILVDDNYRSSVDSIYAAGDVIGFPSLASTSAEQGRVAALRAIGEPVTWHNEVIPYGIYTIPEISMVGKTEQELIDEKIEYFVGTALWRDTARGKILGDLSGALKMLFTKEDRRLVGVHIIGEGATEILHIGQAVMHFGGGTDYFLNTVFNYPTLAEAYKSAAHNAINRLHGRAHHIAPLPEQIYSSVVPPSVMKRK